MDYNHDTWLGYLTEQIVRQVVALAMLKCQGCQDKMKSPLLHLCHQQGLLDKMKCYFEEVRGPMLTSVLQYYDQVADLLPHSDDLVSDSENYCLTGRLFLTIATCEVIYYGRYVDFFNDAYIERAFANVRRAQKADKNKGSC